MNPSASASQQQKTVLITGASSGIGLQLASDYLQQGWKVFACGRNKQGLDKLVGAEKLLFDINDIDAIKAEAERLQNGDFANLDLVILNAGTCEYVDDALHFDSALFERVIRTNVISMGHCISAFLPLMSGGSQLALMGSSAVYLPFPRAEAYGASKAAVQYLASSLALDLKPHGIGVSVICPGFVKTPLTDKNDFAMPMQQTPQQASIAIRKGLAKGQQEIHFPLRFTLLLKFISLLPRGVWQKLVQPKHDESSAIDTNNSQHDVNEHGQSSRSNTPTENRKVR
ncbi:short-chain dehydrogenase [Shewanella sp. c952]|uniref:SDR family NAD(P)-dependent oxidoreductase n=1 Tax=Shewanella sp. c952 TaxID=2815913 RepID=UPI001BC60D35|nr:SDR family NAD(P)-dependent oxidoreductase [Shewanella sp. c952]GIU13249.1 short-chain dehydrogenase [Shewanella sp. c952]